VQIVMAAVASGMGNQRLLSPAFSPMRLVYNVGEWMQDCNNGSYKGAPSDGSPWMKGDCRLAVVRGGGFLSNATFVRSTIRWGDSRGSRMNNHGFRLIQGF
jgi:formylglycine-generating enzyme required for sulfatase activity